MKVASELVNMIEDILVEHYDNLTCSDLLNYYLNEREVDIDLDAIKKNVGKEDDFNQAYLKTFMDLVYPDYDDSILQSVRSRILIEEINPKLITENDYIKNIKIDNISLRSVSIETDYYEIYEGFISDEVKINNDVEITPIGYFSSRVYYPVIKKDGYIWMLISPHEIRTMQPMIDEASGNILTYGLGLGYFAYMVSQKKDVISVTIVEKDPLVIELFKNNILPQFPQLKKIRIVQDEAINYAKSIKEGTFDFVMVDIYHDEKDGLDIYLKKSLLETEKTVCYRYWIEESILVFLRRMVLIYLFAVINNDAIIESGIFGKVVRKLNIVCKDKSLVSLDDVKEFLSIDNLKNICSSLF